MTRITAKLVTTLFALGCGSGAMASPAYGQWNDQPDVDDPSVPTQPAPQPQGTGEDENLPPPSSEGQGGYGDQNPSQAQGGDQDQDEDDTARRSVQTGQRRLGVVVMSLTPELRRFFGVLADRGVLIARVEPSSAAARAGLQVGDVLTRVGSQRVRSAEDVVQALAAQSGERIRIAAVRQGRMVRLFATFSGNQTGIEQNQT